MRSAETPRTWWAVPSSPMTGRLTVWSQRTLPLESVIFSSGNHHLAERVHDGQIGPPEARDLVGVRS